MGQMGGGGAYLRWRDDGRVAGSGADDGSVAVAAALSADDGRWRRCELHEATGGGGTSSTGAVRGGGGASDGDGGHQGRRRGRRRGEFGQPDGAIRCVGGLRGLREIWG